MIRGFSSPNQRNHYHRLKFESDYDLQKANEQFQHALSKVIADTERTNEAKEGKVFFDYIKHLKKKFCFSN